MFLSKAKEHTMFFGMTDITLSQLARCTGLKPRTLQFWTLSGVIHCDPESEHGGPGVPRRYSEDEVAIALVLSEIIRMPLQVGALREIAERFREIMHFGPENGVTDPVYWMTSVEDSMFQDIMRIEESEGRDREYQASILRDRFAGLRVWCALQLALRGIRSVVFPGHRRVTVDEQMLALAVDDTGNWQLSIEHLSHRKDSSVPEEGPPVWSLRLLLNLTRTFARLPSRLEHPAVDTDEGEVA